MLRLAGRGLVVLTGCGHAEIVKAHTVGSMIGLNIGPLRWKPPMIAATFGSPVSRRA